MRLAGILLAFAVVLGARHARAATFSDLRPGARAMGMGMAYTALSNDFYGMFHNPAGLANAPFTQVAGGITRLASPVGVLYQHTLGYTRPFPIRPGATVGAAFSSTRQNGSGGRDSVLFHYSESVRLPQFYITRPVKLGANFKFARTFQTPDSAKKIALGFDGGAILEATRDLRFGLSLLDLVSKTGLPRPTFNMGVAYRWQSKIIFAADARMRPGLSELYPGVEFALFQNLMQLRVGKGFPLDGQSQIALGVGANFSPLLVDFGMQVPVHLNRPAGGFQINLQYRFRAPNFYGLYPGAAARESEGLRSKIIGLEDTKRRLDAEVVSSESVRDTYKSEVAAYEDRIRTLQDRLQQLQIEAEKRQYELDHPVSEPPAPKIKPKPKPKVRPKRRKGVKPVKYPMRHRVRPGDTLRKIAEKYYKDPSLWELIYDANPEKIERGLPVEGAVLIIPRPERR